MKTFNCIYFLGIGGIGMSAIARYYKIKGYEVGGYDKTPSELTGELEEEGIKVHYTDSPKLIPQDKEHTLVIYTPAIPSELNEMKYVLENGYEVVKRSRALGYITHGQRCLAVSGTHGKTTTSTLTAHILTECGEGCSAFVGGISKNYDTNMLVSKKSTVVVEADEFDRSFLQLHPEIAVITAMDADHLDIYGDLEHVHQAFKAFASQVSGTVIAKLGLDITSEDTKAKIARYHYDNPKADFYGKNAKSGKNGCFTFDLCHPGGTIEDITVGIPGWVNVENSIAAAAICLTYGIKSEAIKHAIGTYRGVQRRLDIHVNTPTCSYIDDYAHHPNELATAISSMRDIFPGRKITAVFQPHLYTRTRDLCEGFAESLSKVDKLILLDIYPAREEPIPGVTSKIIFDKVTLKDKVMLKKEDLMDYLSKEPVDVLATFGAGNIDRYIKPIAKMLEDRIAK